MWNGITAFEEAAAVDFTTGLGNIVQAGKTVMGFITGDAYLMTLFCGSVIGLACYFIYKVKKTAKS